MSAIVTKPFRGCPPGVIYPQAFKPGDVLTGDFAYEMIVAGLAKPVSQSEAPQNKDAARFRTTGMDGRNDSDNSERTEPKRRRGRPRKNGS